MRTAKRIIFILIITSLLSFQAIQALQAQPREKPKKRSSNTEISFIEPENQPIEIFTSPQELELKKLTEGNTEFAFKLYPKIQKSGKNSFFSPFSISSALAMTYAGARANTQQEMAESLCFNLEHDELHKSFLSLNSKLANIQKDGKVKLQIANSLWLQKDMEILQDYLNLTKKYYSSGVNKVDFRNNSSECVNIINQWIEEKTNNKIQNLLSPGAANSSTKLILCNAIYFKGDWLKAFKESQTIDRKFYPMGGQEIYVQTMKQTSHFNYREFDDFKALDLPYSGDKVSMVVLLPNEKQGLPSLEEKLSGKNIQRWLKDLDSCTSSKVIVELPKFKVNFRLSLAKALKSMGMNSAFGNSDFSGITADAQNGKLSISEVIHQAFIEVDEKGTEAAAATAVTMVLGCSARAPIRKTYEFKADHPFVFLIRDKVTNSILFVGKILKPMG